MADKPTIIIIKKKKDSHTGSHGGAWKIAYGDFVTAMMAFFLVMWIIGMGKETKHGIAEYFRNMSARASFAPASPYVVHMGGAPPVRPNLMPIAPHDNNCDQQQAELFKKKIDDLICSSLQFNHLRTTIECAPGKDGMTITLADTPDISLFTSESGAELKPESRRLLEGIAAVLSYSRCRFSIEGHSNAQAAGPGALGKWERSALRAVAIRMALAAGGINDDRMVEVAEFGDTRLAIPSDPLNPGNRRVIVIIPYDEPPGWTQ